MIGTVDVSITFLPDWYTFFARFALKVIHAKALVRTIVAVAYQVTYPRIFKTLQSVIAHKYIVPVSVGAGSYPEYQVAVVC